MCVKHFLLAVVPYSALTTTYYTKSEEWSDAGLSLHNTRPRSTSAPSKTQQITTITAQIGTVRNPAAHTMPGAYLDPEKNKIPS